MDKARIYSLLKSNFNYVTQNGYEGYDPKIYDYMPFSSKTSFKPTFKNKVLRRLEIEIFRRKFPNLLIPYLNLCKINAKTTIPYGLGVFMQCYAQMYRVEKNIELLNEAKKVASIASDMLIPVKGGLGIPNPSNGKEVKYGDGVFDDSTAFLPGGSEVFFGFYDLYNTTNDKLYFQLCQQIADGFINAFALKHVSEEKWVFDYSNKGDNSHVLNANALAMSCLALMYKETKDEKYKNIVEKLYNYLEPYMHYKNIPYAGIEDKQSNKSWFGCDAYHTGFTLRGMYETADIFNYDKSDIIKQIKLMIKDFVIDDKIIVYKGKGQKGLHQDVHALSEYIRIFSTFYEFFDESEKIRYNDIVMKNINDFVLSDESSYYYTVNGNKKFYLYMPRWSHGPMMNALSLLYNKI
jgi:hypothetical protein